MKKYFEVVAKCGHVGKKQYYEGKFYQIAESGKEAAKIIRYKGRVKHDHKDAIISVMEISYYEYLKGCEMHSSEAYFNCNSKYEQDLAWDEIVNNVKDEKLKNDYSKESVSNKSIYSGKQKIKNPKKYVRFNDFYEFDYAIA